MAVGTPEVSKTTPPSLDDTKKKLQDLIASQKQLESQLQQDPNNADKKKALKTCKEQQKQCRKIINSYANGKNGVVEESKGWLDDVLKNAQAKIEEDNKSQDARNKKLDDKLTEMQKTEDVVAARKAAEELELEQENQSSDGKDQKNKLDVHELAKKLINKRLNESMEDELNKLSASGAIKDDTLKEKMRAIIRGHKGAALSESSIIIAAQGETEKMLRSYLDTEIADITKSQAISNVNKTTHDVSVKLDAAAKAMDAASKMQEKDLSAMLIKNINTTLDAEGGFKNFCTTLDSKINSNPIMKKLGKTFESNKYLAPVFVKVEQQVGSKLTHTLQPVIAQHVAQVQKIAQEVKRFEDQIKAAEAQLKATLESFENMAINYAKAWTQKLVTDISSKIHIKF